MAALPTPAPPERRELLREFFDSLSDIALTLDRLHAYRRLGQRREVDLAPRTVLSLDEQQPSLLSNPAGHPFLATAPVRVLQIDTTPPSTAAHAAYERSDGTRRMRLGAQWNWGEGSAGYVRTDDLRSELAEVPGDPVVGLRRRRVELGLHWESAGAATTPWQAELGLRHSALTPSAATVQAPEGSANFAVARGVAESTRWPGLSAHATVAQRLGAADAADGVDGGRVEAGMQWRLGPGHPLPWLPERTRFAWREAVRLGLLSDDDALTRRAAYRREAGVEVPDGSPGGAVYALWRQHSLASADDTEALAGWRHGWRLPETWPIETRIEQVWPLRGPDALRATQLGVRTWHDAFPFRTVTADANGVRTTLADSVSLRGQLIQRLADDWLGAAQWSGDYAAPHGQPDAAVTTQKAALAGAWREPMARALHVLSRYSREWRNVAVQYRDPSLEARRSTLWIGHASYVLDPRSTASLRLAHRTVHDDSPGEMPTRDSSLWLARWVENVPGTRWSLSGHVARRRDDRDGQRVGFGLETGYQLSSRLALALGYNPRGFSDNNLTLDERPERGIVLRLRFTVESVLGRWLDAGRTGTAAAARNRAGAWPDRPDAVSDIDTPSPFLVF